MRPYGLLTYLISREYLPHFTGVLTSFHGSFGSLSYLISREFLPHYTIVCATKISVVIRFVR